MPENIKLRYLLIVTDPLTPDGTQLRFLRRVIKSLEGSFRISLFSSFISDEIVPGLDGVKILGRRRTVLFFPYIIYTKINGHNESIAWFVSWFMEATAKLNSKYLRKKMKNTKVDVVLNLAQTVAFQSDLNWGQSVPLNVTLSEMKDSSFISLLPNFALNLIGKLDRSLISRTADLSQVTITNSNFTKSVYESLGINVAGVVYSVSDLHDFVPKIRKVDEKYVLAYIGKEVEIETLLSAARRGVKIIAFGSKIPPGAEMNELRDTMMDFRGYVSKEELIMLYSNALFTFFPFTFEPLGYIPLESIACGTPVLTYRKQGPSETVKEDVSGWFADNQSEIVSKALALYEKGSKMEVPEEIMQEARNISNSSSADFLNFLQYPG